MQEKAGVVVSVVMGSDSDLPVMEEAVKVLEAFAIPHELFLTSAHRTPERTATVRPRGGQAGGPGHHRRRRGRGPPGRGHRVADPAPRDRRPHRRHVAPGAGRPPRHGPDAGGHPRGDDGHRQGGGEECGPVRRPDPRPGGCRIFRRNSSPMSGRWPRRSSGSTKT